MYQRPTRTRKAGVKARSSQHVCVCNQRSAMSSNSSASQSTLTLNVGALSSALATAFQQASTATAAASGAVAENQSAPATSQPGFSSLTALGKRNREGTIMRGAGYINTATQTAPHKQWRILLMKQ